MIARSVIASLLLPAALAATGGPGDQRPPLAIRPASASGKALLTLGAVLDDATLEEAVRSGLPVRLKVRVELWRDGFIDQLEEGMNWTTVVVFEPLERQFILRPPDGPARRFSDYTATRAAVESEYSLGIGPRRPGRYYYTGTLEIETLSLSDLDELERWLRGELGPAVSGERPISSAVGEGAKRLLIRLLGLPSRRAEARSDRFRIDG